VPAGSLSQDDDIPYVVFPAQDQLKAEIASLETWLAECDPESDEQNADVVREVTTQRT